MMKGKKGHMPKNNLLKAKSAEESNSDESFLEKSTEGWFDLSVIWIYSGVVLAVYVYTMYPSIPGGDSGELITAAHELGVAHPPGYPVFTLLSWLAIRLIPMGSVAWRVNLLNAAMSAGAAFVFSLAIYRQTCSVSSAVFGSSVWSFGSLAWTWAGQTEVFSLNNLFVAALLYLLVTFQQAASHIRVKVACTGALVSGLALCNQHTVVVYVAVIAVWVLTELARDKVLSLVTLVQVGVSFLCGLVPYIYLPLASTYSPARWTWGDQSSLWGFITHVLRREYGTFDLAKGQNKTSSSLMFNLWGYGGHCVQEFTLLVVILTIAGLCHAVTRILRPVLVCVAMAALYLGLFSWRANLDLDNKLYLGVVERFWMQADMVIIFCAAVGYSWLEKFMETKVAVVKHFKLGLAVAILACSLQMQRNFGECNQHENTAILEFGSRLYNNMPHNALVLTVGDLPSNVLRYMYRCENNRPDVQVLDQELMSYKWFVPRLRHAYPNVTFPGHHMDSKNGMLSNGQQVFNFRAFLNAHYGRYPIIGCIGMQEREISWKQEYELFPYGPCFLVTKKGKPLNIEEFLPLALNISKGWNYTYQGFDGRGWERVATDEMWSAKVNIPLELYLRATNHHKEGSQEYNDLMIKAYQFYKAAVDATPVNAIPFYWHTNYALACERLLRIDHGYSKAQLLNDTIFHFEMNLKKNPHDKDAKVIRESVENLKTFIGVIK
ncbi:transmembrane protein 260-like isoform X2 [Mya arenaria]|uniref:transmembrane protein 260-like isoform X2 n=1 Tax=Mya arenaria TaxID=6604 RepID=UPI0022E1F0DF|nr:transmembrane protein 260-like isoform X2 [Mya arenaria]